MDGLAIGRKTGGRKAGTPNKSKKLTIMQLAKRMVEDRQVDEALVEQTPLAFLLSVMRDPSYPPGIRVECAKASLPFCHAKMAEQPSEQVRQITEIRTVIVEPKDDPSDLVHLHEVSHQIVEPGAIRSAMPAAQEPGERQWPADPPDAVGRARSRLDRMRGIN